MSQSLLEITLLPPGLHPPTAAENPENFMSERYDGKVLEPWHILDYGAFVVGLALFAASEGKRRSLMPVREDFYSLREAGYGPSLTRIQREFDGVKKLQENLGFYPRNCMPDTETVLQRYKWIATTLQSQGVIFDTNGPISELLNWCSSRNLAPHKANLYTIFGGNIDEVRAVFGRKKHNISGQISKTDMYRFGARVIHENGGAISHTALNTRYADSLGIEPSTAVERIFGGNNRFWLEYGRITDLSALTTEEIVIIGTQVAIRNNDFELTTQTIQQLASKQAHPTISAIKHHFSGVQNYQEQVRENLRIYTELRDELAQTGINPSTIRIFCAKFEPTLTFREWLVDRKDTLAKLSVQNDTARYVLKLVENGPFLLDPVVEDMQMTDLARFLKKLGILEMAEVRFVLQAMPRIEVEPTLKRYFAGNTITRK